MKHISILCLAVIAIGLAGCSKGTIRKDDSMAQVRVFALTKDSLRFNVSVNEGQPFRIDDERYYSSYVLLSPERTYRLRIEQLPAGKLIVDTMIAPVLGTGALYPVTVYQATAGAQPMLLLPDAKEPLPVQGTGKFRIGYRNTSFPGVLKFRFFTSLTTPAADSCIVSRDQFSDNWVTLPFGYQTQYEVLNGITNEVLLARGQFYPASTGEEYCITNGQLSILYYEKNAMVNNPFIKLY